MAAGALELWTLDEIEATAWRDLAAAAPAAVGLGAVRIGGVTMLTAPRLGAPVVNRALGLGNGRPATDALLDEVLVRFTALGVHAPWIQVGPAARPGALGGWLAARGFAPAPRRAWIKMVRGREAPPAIATTLTIREVGVADAAALAAVLGAAHGLPPVLAGAVAALVGRPGWRAYGALDGAALVAGALLHVADRAAWLGFGGTLPSHRGRGAQGALMARRIADAIDLGATVIATETGVPRAGEPSPSLDNMRRCGFRGAGERVNYGLAAHA